MIIERLEDRGNEARYACTMRDGESVPTGRALSGTSFYGPWRRQRTIEGSADRWFDFMASRRGLDEFVAMIRAEGVTIEERP